jgi:hypothetical protein
MHVYSVEEFRIKDQIYVFVSGDGEFLDIFEVKTGSNSVQLGKECF